MAFIARGGGTDGTPVPADLPQAADLLRQGALVAFPTETVYGLGADATNGQAVAAVFAAKGRPRFNPLICHCPDAAAAWHDVVPDTRAERLAARFWPGPLTLVLPRRAGSRVDPLTGAGLETLAVRVPAHPLALALLRAVGRPLAAPSANPSGRVSPTTAEHVLQGLAGRIAAVLDGGPCPVGVESTVLDLTGARPVVLRPGGIPAEEIAAEIGPLATPAAEEAAGPRAPGMLRSHYAPVLPLRLAGAGGRAGGGASRLRAAGAGGQGSCGISRRRGICRRPPRACSLGCAGWMRRGGRGALCASPPCRCPRSGLAWRSTTGCAGRRRPGVRSAPRHAAPPAAAGGAPAC